MTSQKNNFFSSDWMPYPTEAEWLSAFRLVVPIASGMYGMPGNQIALTSNHQLSLVNLGSVDGVATFALDGGGFPVEVAAAFGLISPPPENFFREYIESVGGNVAFYIPENLAIAWNWRDSDKRLGGTICVVSDIFLDSSIRKLPAFMIRLYTAVRLFLAQLVLLLVSIMIINPQAFIPVAVMLFIGICLIAGFWNALPSNGWWKGVVIGAVCAVSTAAISFFQIFSFPPLFLVGIFLMIFWMGELLMGARS